MSTYRANDEAGIGLHPSFSSYLAISLADVDLQALMSLSSLSSLTFLSVVIVFMTVAD